MDSTPVQVVPEAVIVPQTLSSNNYTVSVYTVGNDVFLPNKTLSTYLGTVETEATPESNAPKADPNNTLFNAFLSVYRLPRKLVTMGKELGNGAFGEVYQGQWGDRVVALKKIDVDHAQKSLYGAFYAGQAIEESQIIEALQWEVYDFPQKA